jgi:hypothetical protein
MCECRWQVFEFMTGLEFVHSLRLTAAVAITRMPDFSLNFDGQMFNLINELEQFLGL